MGWPRRSALPSPAVRSPLLLRSRSHLPLVSPRLRLHPRHSFLAPKMRIVFLPQVVLFLAAVVSALPAGRLILDFHVHLISI